MSLVAVNGMRFTEREYERRMRVEDEKETNGDRKHRAFVHRRWLRFLCHIRVQTWSQQSTNATQATYDDICTCS